MWPITTSLVATKIVSRVEALVTFLQFWSIRYGVDYVFYQQGSQNRKIGCKFYFHDVLGFRHVSFRINLDAPPEPPFILNPAVGLETGTGFAAACNQGERLKPVRGAAAERAGGPLGSVS